MKPKTIADHLKAAPKPIPIPWDVSRIFNEGRGKIHLSGDMASVTEHGDSATLDELRYAVEWYVKQLNGTVKWDE